MIVGDGAAGLSAARFLRMRDLAASVVMVADDPHPAYYRAALTNYLLGELRDDQLWAVPPGFFGEHRIERLHARATAIEDGAVQLSDGAAIPFDGLLIASGARARDASFEGAQLAGVTTLRTLRDAQAILDAVLVRRATRAVVVGGGPLAVELATALSERSVAVALLVRHQALLAGALDAEASDLVVARLRHLGVDVRLGDEVQRVSGGDAVECVHTVGGASLPCELVGVAIGVLPNSEWALSAGLAHERGLITVDDRMRTSIAGVHAAGDVAKPPGNHYQLWEPAQVQGRIAAMTMTDREEHYDPGPLYFATRLGDLDFASVGRTDDSAADRVFTNRSAATGTIAYRKLWLRDGHLVGALMLGHRSERVRLQGRALRKLIAREADVGAIAESLFDPHFDVAAWLRQSEMLVARPQLETTNRAGERKAAAVRGTQVMHVTTTAPKREKAVAASGPLLSVGFRAPVTQAIRLPRAAGVLESNTTRYPIELAMMVIGRDRLCDIVVDHRSMSFRHAAIVRHRDALYLRDLGSRHGTLVNGAPVITPHPLRHGDRIHLPGLDLTFKSNEPTSTLVPTRAAYLEGIRGPCLGVRFALEGEQLTLGRDEASSVRLNDISVSRRHALISAHGSSWSLCDLHSSKGTSHNGRPLLPGVDQPLTHGDEIGVGDTVLRFGVR